MRQLVPPLVIARAAAGVGATRDPGAALFVDVRGFVALTRALAAEGPLGVEVLAETITALFEPAVAAVEAHGGFVSSYAGDAFTALFLGPQREARARARVAAELVVGAVRRLSPRATPLGTFDLAVRVGVGVGEIDGHLFRSGGRAAYAFGGSAIERAIEAQAAAEPSSVGERGEPDVHDVGAPSGLPAPTPDRAREVSTWFFAPDVLDDPRVGELRDVVAMFVALPALALDEAVGAVLSTAAATAAHVRQIELGDKGPVALLYWGAPTASERDVERALTAASSLAAGPAGVRVAVARGRVFAGYVGARSREEYACYGDAVNLAARILAATPEGEAWVDPELARLGRATHAFAPLEPRAFKGFDAPVTVHRLLGARATSRAAGPLLGREREQREIVDALRRAVAGRGCAIVVEGDPGVGKSRLVAAAQREVGDELDWRATSVDPIDARALGPIRALVGSIVGASLLDTPEGVREKVRSTLDAHSSRAPELPLAAPMLCALLDAAESDSPFFRLPPPARLAAQERAVIALLAALASTRPQVVQLDDAHLADPETRGLLDRASAALADQPIALLSTTRPDTGAALPAAAVRVCVGPLAADDVRALGEALVGRPLSREVGSWLVARTDGNPLFVEHAVLLLSDLGALDAPPDASLVPPDLRSVLVARLDRLPRNVRDVVSDASALGREFPAAELGALLQARGLTPPSATPRIDEATQRGVWSSADQERLMFAHAMLRDAAYELSLASARRELHAKVAVALRALYAGALEPHAGRLAFHHAAAGQTDEALHAYRLAAGRALRDGAHREAAAHVTRALSLLPELSDRSARRAHELALRMQEGVARIVTHGQGADETRRAYERAHELAASDGDAAARFSALFGLRTFHLFRAEHARSRELSWACRELAATTSDPHLVVEGDHVLGNSLFWAGELEPARARLEAAIVGMRPEMHGAHLARFAQTPRVTAMFPYATTLWLMGEPDRALLVATEAHAFARGLRHPFSEALVLQTLAYLHLHRDEPELALARATELVKKATTEGFPAYAPVGQLLCGCARARLGDVDVGLDEAEAAAATMRARGVKVSSTLSSALIARAALDGGRRALARRAVDRGLADVDATGERAFAAELLRLLAALTGDDDVAARANELAEAQGALAIAERLRRDRNPDRRPS